MTKTDVSKDPVRSGNAPSRAEPVRDDRDRGRAMALPGPAEHTAEVVKQVSVEGRPAEGDAKSGPGGIVLDMVLAMLVIAVLAAIAGAAFGPLVGLVCLAIGVLAMALNPVMGASLMRVEDRAEAARRLNEQQD